MPMRGWKVPFESKKDENMQSLDALPLSLDKHQTVTALVLHYGRF